MKSTKILISALIAVALFACNSKQEQKSNGGGDGKTETVADNSEIKVYYYHGSRRCATCKAVGSVAEETVKSNFAENKEVSFLDINIEEEKNADLVAQFEMSGSGLLICKGEKKEDLTGLAFQNALNSPEKLKEKMIEVINANI